MGGGGIKREAEPRGRRGGRRGRGFTSGAPGSMQVATLVAMATGDVKRKRKADEKRKEKKNSPERRTSDTPPPPTHAHHRQTDRQLRPRVRRRSEKLLFIYFLFVASRHAVAPTAPFVFTLPPPSSPPSCSSPRPPPLPLPSYTHTHTFSFSASLRLFHPVLRLTLSFSIAYC